MKKQKQTNSKVIFLAATALFVARWASASVYSGSVLYPLSVPNGFSSISSNGMSNISGISGGQTVGSDQDGVDDQGNEIAHALLWTADGPVDLNPSGSTVSAAFGNSLTEQVGYGSGAGKGYNNHAMLWTGTAASAVDINPSGFRNSIAYGTNGAQQVGIATGFGINDTPQAMLWTGTAASAISLNPTNLSLGSINYSQGQATDGVHEVGIVEGAASGNYPWAVMWSGTADSAVNLNPTDLGGITQSLAIGVSETQQVGSAEGSGTGGKTHAILWTGSADTAIDLQPTKFGAFTSSAAIATNGTQQVGDAGTSSQYQAMLWNGSADSAINLQNLLPASGTWVDSTAYEIDSAGNIYGIAYSSTYNGFSGDFAVEWSSVPEPASDAILLLAGAGMLIRRRRVTSCIHADVSRTTAMLI